MLIRPVEREDIERIIEIDRSEIVDFIYYYRNAKRVRNKEHYDLRGWPRGELERYIPKLYDLYERGRTIFGAFENSEMIDVAALKSKFIGRKKDTLQLTFLYVSKNFRCKGIGKKLVERAIDKKLYELELLDIYLELEI